MGAGGDFLGEEHTLRYMRTEFAPNTISDRQLREYWEADGSSIPPSAPICWRVNCWPSMSRWEFRRRWIAQDSRDASVISGEAGARCEGSRAMCGIAGLILKSPGDIGKHLVRMLDGCQHRGPDSTGFAMYHAGRGACADLPHLPGLPRRFAGSR